MSAISLFPIKIYKTFYDKADWIKEHLINKLEHVWEPSANNNQQFMRDGTLCSYHVEPDINKKFPEETKDLIDFTNEAGKAYWKELDYFPGLEPYVMEMWANKTPRGGWIHSHLHLSLPLTAVYYVDASPEQGNIVFENPLDLLMSSMPVNYLNGKYQFEHEISVKSGDLIIFPGYLKHKVLPNQTDRPRYVLGMTFGTRGFYWQKNWVTEERGSLDEKLEERSKKKLY